MAKVSKHFDFTTPLNSCGVFIGNMEISGVASLDKEDCKASKIDVEVEQVFFIDKMGNRSEIPVSFIEGLNYGELPIKITEPAYAHAYKLFFPDYDFDQTTDMKQDLSTEKAA